MAARQAVATHRPKPTYEHVDSRKMHRIIPLTECDSTKKTNDNSLYLFLESCDQLGYPFNGPLGSHALRKKRNFWWRPIHAEVLVSGRHDTFGTILCLYNAHAQNGLSKYEKWNRKWKQHAICHFNLPDSSDPQMGQPWNLSFVWCVAQDWRLVSLLLFTL